jgi:hypothetical protein
MFIRFKPKLEYSQIVISLPNIRSQENPFSRYAERQTGMAKLIGAFILISLPTRRKWIENIRK